MPNKGRNHAYAANRVRAIPGPAEEGDLRVMARRVSALWNVGNYECRQRFLGGETVPGTYALQEKFKAHRIYRLLPSDVAQEVFKKLAEAWKSYFRLRQKWKNGEMQDKPGLPRYRKDRRTGHYCEDFIPIKTGRSYDVAAHELSVTLPHDLRTEKYGGGRLSMPYRGLRRYSGTQGRGELRYDQGRRRWYFQWAVKVGQKESREWTRAAGIDLGIRTLASVSVEDEPIAVHYSGREVLKDYDYFGRQIAKHQRELAHRGKKTSRRLSRLYQRRRTRLEHAWEAIAADMVKRLKRQRVGVVYIGHPKHIRRDRDSCGLWNGRIHNFWGFKRSIVILKKHLLRARIQVFVVGERGTSSRCPRCRRRNVVRSPRTWLRCREPDCGLVIHSDQAGSRNMIHDQRPGTSWDGLEASPRTETLSWQRHTWDRVDSENQRSTSALSEAA
jgi:putative transposase